MSRGVRCCLHYRDRSSGSAAGSGVARRTRQCGKCRRCESESGFSACL